MINVWKLTAAFAKKLTTPDISLKAIFTELSALFSTTAFKGYLNI